MSDYILVHGDSIDSGYAGSSPAPNTDGDVASGSGETSPSGYLANQYPTAKIHRIAQNGAQMAGAASATAALAALSTAFGVGYTKYSAFLGFGHNDLATNDSVANIQANMLTWISNMRAAHPTVKLIGTTLHYINYGSGVQATFEPRRQTLNTWLRWYTVAQGHSDGFDAICDVAGDSRLGTDYTNTMYYYTDQVHLSDIGYVVRGTIMQATLVANAYIGAGVQYYVRTDGSNSNNGLANSSGGAWLTVQHAVSVATAADSITVVAGTYAEHLASAASGTSTAKITIQAAGTVNLRSFYCTHGWLVIDGFTFNGTSPTRNALIESNGATGDTGSSHDILVKNCIFDTDTIGQYHGLVYGEDWIFETCDFLNTWKASLDLAGSGHIVRDSYFSCQSGADLMHVLGDDIIFRDNEVRNWGGRTYSSAANSLWNSNTLKVGMTYYFLVVGSGANFANVRADGDAGPYTAGEDYYPDVLHRGFVCTGTTPTAWGTGTVLDSSNHPDFFQADTDFEYPSVKRFLCERNRFFDCPGCQFGNVSDSDTNTITDWVFRNNLFVRYSNTFNLFAPGFKYYNNTFYQCANISGNVVIWGNTINGIASQLRFKNNLVVECGTPTLANSGRYGGDAATDQQVDYNGLMGIGAGATKTGIDGTHNVNGQDPKFVDPENEDFRLESDSPMIGAGVDLESEGFTDDINGGGDRDGWDIGCYSFALAGGGGEDDTTPPTPNPTTIASAIVDGTTQITVTVTTSSDETALAGFPYNIAIDGAYQGYQASPTKVFTGLTPNTSYAFKAKVKDLAGNITTESSVTNRTTAQVTPAAPRAASRNARLMVSRGAF